MCFKKVPPKSPKWAPRPSQDPPKIPPIRAQEAPKRVRKGGQNGSNFQLPFRTPSGPVWDPFGVYFGTILGAIMGPFGEPFRTHSLAYLASVFGTFLPGFSVFFYGFLQHFFQGSPRLLDSSLVSSRFLYGIS